MMFARAHAISKSSLARDYSCQVLHTLNLQQLNESVPSVDYTDHTGVQKMEGTVNSKPVSGGGDCDEMLKMMEELTEELIEDISDDENVASQNYTDDAKEDNTTIDQLFKDYRKLLIDQETYEEEEAEEVTDSSPCISDQESDENGENDPDIEQYVAKLTARKKKSTPKKLDFLCPVCGKLFNTQNGQRHFYVVHSSYVRDNLCQVCGKTFTTKYSLEEHCKTHVTEARFKCSFPNCEKLFTLKRYRQKHENAVHRKKRKVQSNCKICGKRFPSREQMEAHKSWHKPEDLPKCRICFAAMSSHVTRLVHERRHRDEKYPCTYCDKKFLHYAALVAHHRIHTGELPYKCPKCSLAFSQHYSRVRHLKTHKEGEELLKCDQCDNRYRSKRDLNRHLKLHLNSNQEAKEVLLKCPTCPFQYRTLRGLRGHHLSSHGAPLCKEDLACNPSDESARHNAPSSLPQSTEETSDRVPRVPDICSQPSLEGKARQEENSLKRLWPLRKEQMRMDSPSNRSIIGSKKEIPGSMLRQKQRILKELADLTDISTEDDVKSRRRRSSRNTATPNYFIDEEGSEDELNSTSSESGSVYEPSDVDEIDEYENSLDELEAEENEEEICDEEQTKHTEDTEHSEDEEGKKDEPKMELKAKVVEGEEGNDEKHDEKEKMGSKEETDAEKGEEEFQKDSEGENTAIMECKKGENPKQNEEEEIEVHIKIKMENECEDSKELIGDNLFSLGSLSLSNLACVTAVPSSSELLPAIHLLHQETDTKIMDIKAGETPTGQPTSGTGFLSYHANSDLEKDHEERKMSVSNLNSCLQKERSLGTDGSFRTAKLILRRINLEECLGGVVVIKGECSDVPEEILPKPSTWSCATLETL